MPNLQTGTIRVSKEVLDSIKIYCRKHNKNMGEWVESAWRFIEKNEFDIYDEEATPCLPVQQEQPQGKEAAALYAAMTEFVNAQRQLQLQLPNNNREDVSWYQNRLDEADKERQILQNRLNLALSELRHCKGMFATADERVLKELGII